ncbi:hypothetical protein DPMN_174090 [Dreissena polymorpha]|uniref:Uncharacterized protein n=1 Tax=Dreissena polymorpha TaxID=45954 RepID=A0A9D4IG45_DREPO|nr:hypothetical protein DPMN_174090 [Dreissena polymorpha]
MVYYYHPHTGRFEQSTRSSVRASTVGPVSRSYADDYLYVPRTTYHHHPYDTTGNEYSTHSEINRELILSTAAMDDNYDITARSRARDRDVIAAANRAVAGSEGHSSARAAVAHMRTMRGRSVPPGPPKVTRTEAALLASKVESLMPERKRRPKSVYAQARLRALERERRGSGEKEVVAGFIEDTSNLHAHRPVRGSTYYKAHWDADGNVKKPNIMSMERRLDALISPDDLLILPRSLGGVKAQLRDVKDRMDRHRQLMDRYLVTDKGLSSDDMKVLMSIKAALAARQSEPASQNEAKQSSTTVKKSRQ